MPLTRSAKGTGHKQSEGNQKNGRIHKDQNKPPILRVRIRRLSDDYFEAIKTAAKTGVNPVASAYAENDNESTEPFMLTEAGGKCRFNNEGYISAPKRCKQVSLKKAEKKVKDKATKSRRKITASKMYRNKESGIAPEVSFKDLIKDSESLHVNAMNSNGKEKTYCTDICSQEIENAKSSWRFILSEGFTIILYGYGSKSRVLNDYIEYLNEYDIVLILDGLGEKFNPKLLLTTFCQIADVEIPKQRNSIDSCLKSIISKANESSFEDDIFIVIYHIERLAISSPSLVELLSYLNTLSFVHLIVSSNHINPTKGITMEQSIRFNFYWQECNTFVPYDKEIEKENQILDQEIREISCSKSLALVLKSVNKHSKEAFAEICKIQLEKSNEINSLRRSKVSIEFRELAEVCKRKFIANSDTKLRLHLTEFIDHNILEYIGKGNNVLRVKMDLNDLKRAVQMIEAD